jgi:hypothetical protein
MKKNKLYDEDTSLADLIQKSMDETPIERLKRMFHVIGTDKKGRVTFFSIDPITAATKNRYRTLLSAAEQDPALAPMLIAPIKELEGYEYLMPDYDDFHMSWTIKGSNPSRHITEIDLSLGTIIDYIISKSGMESYFITDDKTKKMIGFIAYNIDPNDKKIINKVKLFRFDQGDAPILIDDLLKKKYKEVRWHALKNNPAVKGYDTYLKIKKDKGFETTRIEENDKVYYSIKSKTVH